MKTFNVNFTPKQLQHLYVELDTNYSGLLEEKDFKNLEVYIDFRNDLYERLSKLDVDDRKMLNIAVVKELMNSLGLARLYDISIKQCIVKNDMINIEKFVNFCFQVSLITDNLPTI